MTEVQVDLDGITEEAEEEVATTIESVNEDPEFLESGEPVAVSILGTTKGSVQVILDGVPVRRLLSYDIEQTVTDGTTLTLVLQPDIVVQELLTGEMLEERIKEIAKLQQQRGENA